jgi:adenine deaminase
MKKSSLAFSPQIEDRISLINVLSGKVKADLAVVDADLVNVYTGEVIHSQSIVMKGELIAYVGDEPGDIIGPDTTVINAGGKTVIPGFIEGHTHLADCKYSPYEFMKRIMTGGTTTIITETMEPFPLRGFNGVLDFLAALQDQPIKFFATAPAMVSISKNVKIPSGEVLNKLLSRDDVLGLGESYWQGVMQRQEEFLPNFMEVLQSGKRLEGHSAGARGRKLMSYIATGVSSCHEPVNVHETLEKLRMGLYVMIREGSVRKDLGTISAIKDAGVDLRRLILVTDGVNPEELLQNGYMERLVQKAIDAGINPVNAIQMATLNVAEHFGLDSITGGIAPGKHGDMVIVPSLKEIKAEYVLSKGRVIAKDGELLVSPRRHRFSRAALKSVKLPREVTTTDFQIKIDESRSNVRVRVIDMVTELVAREYIASVPVVNGLLTTDTENDLLKVAAIDRANAAGKMSVGLIRGFNLKKGAIASTSAWDSSDIIVVGANDSDMAAAVNRVHSIQGGAVLCVNDDIVAEIPLPVFGLMTDMPLEKLAGKFKKMNAAMKNLGFPYSDPLLTMATLTGAAIPFIRICEEGLIDIKDGKTLDLFPL